MKKRMQLLIAMAAIGLFVGAQSLSACPGKGSKGQTGDEKGKDARTISYLIR